MDYKLLPMPPARFLLVTLVALLSIAVRAEKLVPYQITEAEFKLLPPACYARMKGDHNIYKLWENKIGSENMLHLHHYCLGLTFINRAKLSIDKNNKRFYLNEAIANFEYVLKNWPANSVLRPEAEAGMKESQLMLKML